MAKFQVMLIETVIYKVDVEADNMESAMDIACETWNDSEQPSKDFESYGQGVEAETVIELKV